MTDLPVWAKDRAREWLTERAKCPPGVTFMSGSVWMSLLDLAVLLVEVEDRCVEDFTSEEPCPKCGHGVSRECYGCQMVEQRKALLAEVRRVVEEVRNKWGMFHSVAPLACTEILSRLDALK